MKGVSDGDGVAPPGEIERERRFVKAWDRGTAGVPRGSPKF